MSRLRTRVLRYRREAGFAATPPATDHAARKDQGPKGIEVGALGVFLALGGEGGGGLGEGGGGGEVGFAEVGEAHCGIEERGAVGAGDFVIAGGVGGLAFRRGGSGDGEGLGGLELGGLVDGFAVADLGDEAVQEEGEGGEAREV